MGGARQSAIGPRKHERPKTFPGIGNRPVTSRSQESSGARMLVRWFFMTYDLEKICLIAGIRIAMFVYFVNQIFLIYYCKNGLHM
jgi:hypothetical protein